MKKLGMIMKFIGITIAASIVLYLLSMFVVNIRPAKDNLRVPFSSEDNFSDLIDTADLFDKSQEKTLRERIIACSEELEMNIIVYINDVYRSDPNVEDFTANYYDQCAGEEFTDGVFMYIDLSSNAYDYLSCSGKAGIIYGGRTELFFDEYARKRPSSAYAPDPDAFGETVEHFCDTLEGFMRSYEPSNITYQEDKLNGIYFFDYNGKFYVTKHLPPGIRVRRLFMSFFAGFILAEVIYICVKSHYRFKNSPNPGIYVRRDRTNFREKSDTFIRSYVTKHKIETSSSGGYRGGGSRGGGGHHHSGGHVGGGRHF